MSIVDESQVINNPAFYLSFTPPERKVHRMKLKNSRLAGFTLGESRLGGPSLACPPASRSPNSVKPPRFARKNPSFATMNKIDGAKATCAFERRKNNPADPQ